jgi:hypothetical protein
MIVNMIPLRLVYKCSYIDTICYICIVFSRDSIQAKSRAVSLYYGNRLGDPPEYHSAARMSSYLAGLGEYVKAIQCAWLLAYKTYTHVVYILHWWPSSIANFIYSSLDESPVRRLLTMSLLTICVAAYANQFLLLFFSTDFVSISSAWSKTISTYFRIQKLKTC